MRISDAITNANLPLLQNDHFGNLDLEQKATWNYFKIIAVENDSGPISTLFTHHLPENNIEKKEPRNYLRGHWGNPSFFSGTYGATGFMNFFRSDGSWTVNEIKEKSFDYFRSKGRPNIHPIPTAQFYSLDFQWPLVDATKTFYYLNDIHYFGPAATISDPKNPESFLDYKKLTYFAKIAELAYDYSHSPSAPTTHNVVGSIIDVGPSKATAIAVLSDDEKYLIISCRGTDNCIDIETDAELYLQNIIEGGMMKDHIAECYQFYIDILKDYPHAKVILTGHSLGGYIASMIALKTGEIARVFSSPANYILNRRSNLMSDCFSLLDRNYIPMPNVVNFARCLDPIVDLSGRHVCSEIYFPEESSRNLGENHKLLPFITALENKAVPKFVFLNPDMELFDKNDDPITLQLNYHGAF